MKQIFPDENWNFAQWGARYVRWGSLPPSTHTHTLALPLCENQSFFQDLFPNYRIYCGRFPIFKTFLLLVFEICIIVRDSVEIKIYSSSSHNFLGQNLTYIFFMPNFGIETWLIFKVTVWNFQKNGKTNFAVCRWQHGDFTFWE